MRMLFHNLRAATNKNLVTFKPNEYNLIAVLHWILIKIQTTKHDFHSSDSSWILIMMKTQDFCIQLIWGGATYVMF